MTKAWLFIGFLFSTAAVSQSNPLIAPKLDREVLVLRQEARLRNAQTCTSALQRIEDLWSGTVALLYECLPEERASAVIANQRGRLDKMAVFLDHGQFDGLSTLCESFFTELVNLHGGFESDYPLDQLWRYKILFDDLHHIVRDPMLELQEWNEIDRLYEKMNCAWQEYELLYQDLIPIYFPDFNSDEQKGLYEEMAGCLDRLRAALDTGYRPDFQLPCDDIGRVLEKNLSLFTESPPGSL